MGLTIEIAECGRYTFSIQERPRRDFRTNHSRQSGAIPIPAPCASPHRWSDRYLIELATEENTLLALEPMRRMVPTTITRMTASITAYSAMSCPCSSRHRLTTLSLIDIV